MIEGSGAPPRLFCRLLARALPSDTVGRSIHGDLLEEFHRRPPGWRRAVWFMAAALHLAGVFTWRRLVNGVKAILTPASVGDDVRAGLRLLRRDRGTATLAVVTLAIGIGSVTAIFSALYGSLLKPLPFRDPDALVLIGDRDGQSPPHVVAGNIALANVLDLAGVATTVSAVVPYRDLTLTLAAGGVPAARLRAQEVGGGFFALLGLPLLAGRDIHRDDERPGAPGVVVVSEQVWREQLGSSPLGGTVAIDGEPHTVVGIAGRITQLGRPQVWRPLRPEARALRRNARQVYAIGRLAPGASLSAAQVELDTHFAALRRQFTDIAPARGVAVMPLADWLIGERGRTLLWLLAGAVALVLVIACVNVTNLLLVRAERRQADFALRAALGATHSRLVREMTAEAIALSLAGAALGLVFAFWAVRLLVDLYGAALPRAWEIGLDARALAASSAVALAVAVAVVVIPASRLPRAGVRRGLPADARGHSRTSRTQHVLVAAETGIAMVLLAIAGLLVSTVSQLAAQDLGVRAEGAVLFDVSFASAQRSPEATARLADSLLGRLGSLPGVTVAAGATRRPLFGGNNTAFSIAGRGDAPGFLEIRDVTPRYFDALGVSLLAGRGFRDVDARTSGVALVNRTFERTFFPGASALGHRLTLANSSLSYEIVGVASDMREFGPTGEPRPTAYFPYGSGPYGTTSALTMIVRTNEGDPMDVVPDARQALQDLDPHVALADPITLADQARSRIGRDRLAVRALLALSGAIALGLTAVGLYGVTAYSVARRTREIGIRRALGATQSSVVSLLFRQGIAPALPGLAAGSMAALFGGRLVESYLYGVRPADPRTVIAAGLLLLAAVAVASWIPARRAARVEAADALRS
jgi:predicted permease